MAKRVPEAAGAEIKLKPHERVVEFNSKQMYDDLKRRGEIVEAGRALSGKRDAIDAELAALQAKLTKLDDKVKGYVATKFRPLLNVTEDTREVVLKPDGIVALVVFDKVEEYRMQVLAAHAELTKRRPAPAEAKKS